MVRLLSVCALMAAALVTAASQHLSAGSVHACTLGWFNVSALGESQGVEVAAIGTLGEQHGAAIELIAPHEPLPLLAQIDNRYQQGFDISYLERGPEQWRLRMARK